MFIINICSIYLIILNLIFKLSDKYMCNFNKIIIIIIFYYFVNNINNLFYRLICKYYLNMGVFIKEKTPIITNYVIFIGVK